MIANEIATFRMPDAHEIAESFEAMLPTIQRVASYGFRHRPRWRREELIADVVAKAFEAFVDLTRGGRAALAYPSVLANFAIRQIRDGRRMAGDGHAAARGAG